MDDDVLVVGAGPVGLACALLPARESLTVTVLECRPEPYPRPRAVHFDDEVARLPAASADPRDVLTAQEPAFLAEIGTRVIRLIPAGDAVRDSIDTVDIDAFYLPRLAAAGQVAALVRPDHHVFGTADTAQDLPALVQELRQRLTAQVVAA